MLNIVNSLFFFLLSPPFIYEFKKATKPATNYLCVRSFNKIQMAFSITYNKSEVLQALRYHFIKQKEIKSLMIFVNVYAIITAVLLFMKKIRPEPFLLGSILWILLMAFFWFVLPNLFFRKTTLFKENWAFNYNQNGATLVGTLGEANWEWDTVTHYFESAYFFHFYFSPKSFFLISKTNIPYEDQHIIRGILKDK